MCGWGCWVTFWSLIHFATANVYKRLCLHSGRGSVSSVCLHGIYVVCAQRCWGGLFKRRYVTGMEHRYTACGAQCLSCPLPLPSPPHPLAADRGVGLWCFPFFVLSGRAMAAALFGSSKTPGPRINCFLFLLPHFYLHFRESLDVA